MWEDIFRQEMKAQDRSHAEDEYMNLKQLGFNSTIVRNFSNYVHTHKLVFTYQLIKGDIFIFVFNFEWQKNYSLRNRETDTEREQGVDRGERGLSPDWPDSRLHLSTSSLRFRNFDGAGRLPVRPG